MPARYKDADVIADAIIEKVGKSIVLAMPLGLGKANHIANALVKRATADPSIHLRIFTALTLEKPHPRSELEKRFLEPALNRLFGDYPPLAYAAMLRDGSLPANIEIDEFFFLAGRWLGVARAQQNYISANYTDAFQYILDRGVNVIAQLVASDDDDSRLSLSCNPDITPDLLDARKDGRADFIFAGQINSQLPYMIGEKALVEENHFDVILDSPETDFELFSAPKRPVSLAEHAIGLHTARLVADGGTLQIGIGSVGDAVSYGLILRHRKNTEFKSLVRAIQNSDEAPRPCEDKPFDQGLYGCSEMLVDGFLQLEKAGVLKREVDGAIIHAGFFVESRGFYKTLRDMPKNERARFVMTPVSFTNSLYGGVEERRRQRTHARFINNAMIATLMGAVISDGTEDGQVVSGVGGQFEFVQQAFALDGARSIITLNATRQTGGETVSNVVWSYGHTTIPRHMRDIIITEYGVADLRGKSDADVVAALLAITDSRFQGALLEKAKSAGKIARDFNIPKMYCENTPVRIQAALGQARHNGLLPAFPFGCDFTKDEQRLLPALDRLKQAASSKRKLARLALHGASGGAAPEPHLSAIDRMGLSSPKSVKEHAYRWLVRGALIETDEPVRSDKDL